MARRFDLVAAVVLGATLAGLAGCAQPVRQDAHVEVSAGNVRLDGHDGAVISMAPGSSLAVAHADSAGDATRVELHQGHIHVSSEDHRHGGTVHIHAAGHRFRLERGQAVIGHGPDGPHATLLVGELRGSGHDHPPLRPGDRLTLGDDGHRVHRPDTAETERLMRHTGR